MNILICIFLLENWYVVWVVKKYLHQMYPKYGYDGTG
jgi:hypothetical protein